MAKKQISFLQISFLIVALISLQGCRDQQDYAKALIGNWQGEHEGQQWCLTLLQSGTSNVGEGAANYRASYSNSTNGENREHIYSAGVWLVGVGGRLQINLNPWPLDESLNPMPPTEIKTASARFLIKTLDDDKLVYVEYKPDDSFGDTYFSHKVDSCDSFFKRTK